MLAQSESNACRACSRSKRKCERQMPSCARCADTGRLCIYPPTKRRRAAVPSRPLLPAASSSPVVIVAQDAGAGNDTTADDLLLEPLFSLTASDFAIPSSLQAPSAPQTKTDWFLAPETWRISNSPGIATSVDVALTIGKVTMRKAMKKFVAVLQSWLEHWVSTGSNPFIHPRLYSATFPACVQIAYATLASYIHRAPENTDAVLQIVEDRSNELLLENGAVMNTDRIGAEEWFDREEPQSVDLFGQLARLHALTVYQIIGLFDGDIRSRHVAEGHMAVRMSWASRLFHSAAKILTNAAHAEGAQLPDSLSRPSSHSQGQWQMWILSESIRRTWLVAASISPIYSGLQQGWSVCPGGVMFTNRRGLWSAASATEWEKQCASKNVGSLQWFNCSRFVEDADPSDLDEFGMALLDLTVDADSLLERWREGRPAVSAIAV